MDFVPTDIYNIIFDLFNLKTQINFVSSHRTFRNILSIKHLTNCKNNDILNQSIFSNITSLDASNSTINDLRNVPNLKILFAPSRSSINDDSIRLIYYLNVITLSDIITKNFDNINIIPIVNLITAPAKIQPYIISEKIDFSDTIIYYTTRDTNANDIYLSSKHKMLLKNNLVLNLTELHISGNSSITDVSFMTNLKVLDASGICGIKQEGMMALNLTELNVAGNSSITDVSFMTNLRVLNASHDCGIQQKGIMGLNLTKLIIRNNEYIRDLSFMTNLKVLNASDNYNITQKGITGLNLIELIINYNSYITDLSFMTNLKKLHCVSCKNIKQNSISKLNLTELNTNNQNINDISHMNNLKVLYARGRNCGIDQDSISGLNLICLYISFNKYIYDVSHMSKLKILNISGESAVTQKGILGLNLLKLDTVGNINFDNI